MPEHRRTPLNVVGPFYVEADQCISCRAPEAEAPDLIRFDDTHGSCYFYRQPVGPDETLHAIAALSVCCIGAVRYAGADPEILRRLARVDVANQCDVPPPPGKPEDTPSIVTFVHATLPSTRRDAAFPIAAYVAEALKARAPYLWVSATRSIAPGRAKFRYAMGPKPNGPSTTATLRAANDGPGRWAMRVPHPRGGWASRQIHDILASTPDVSDLRWYTAREWTTWRRWHGHGRWEQFPF